MTLRRGHPGRMSREVAQACWLRAGRQDASPTWWAFSSAEQPVPARERAPFAGRASVSLIIPIFVLGLMASLSPTTIVVFLLLLSTTRARVNALAFLIGWAVSLTIVFVASYALGSSRPLRSGGGRTSVEVLAVVVGAALIAVGIRQWRKRHTARQSASGDNRFMRHLGRVTPWSAAGVGVLKQPWAITAAAALVVVDHGTGLVKVAIAFLLFMAVSTASVGLIFLYYARQPGQAEAQLAALRVRLADAGPSILAVIAMAVGAIVAIDGALSLARG